MIYDEYYFENFTDIVRQLDTEQIERFSVELKDLLIRVKNAPALDPKIGRVAQIKWIDDGIQSTKLMFNGEPAE